MTIVANIADAPYNCPTDQTSDCRAAFLTLKAAAQGQDVALSLPDGKDLQFHTNGGANADNFIFDGIANLTVLMNGASLADNGGTGGFSLGATGISVASPQSSARIVSAKAGDLTITLIAAGDASIFTIGRWIAIGSYDVQGFGQPPNPFFFEYAQIANISGAVITLASPLQFYHLSTFPSYDAGSAFEPDQGGPATAWVLPASWGLANFVFQGGTVDQVGPTYARGRHIKFKDVICLGVDGILPSQNQLWETDNVTATDCEIEVDKMIETMLMKNSTVKRLQFQSGAPNLFIGERLTVTQDIDGTPRNTIIRGGSAIASLKLGPVGYARSDTLECLDSTVSALSAVGYPTDVAGYSISGDTITLSGSSPVPFGIPGTRLMFTGSRASELVYQVISCIKSGSITEVKTNIPNGWPGVPRSGGTLLKIGPHPAPFVNFNNSAGCADVVDLSQSGAQGKPVYSYSKRTYTGNTLVSVAGVNLWGFISQIIVIVSQAYTGAQGTLTLKPMGQFQASALDPPAYSSNTSWSPTVDLKAAPRTITITPTSVTGTVGSDSISAPGLIWFEDTQGPFCSADVSGESSALWPIISIEMITDQGIRLPGRLR